MPRSVQACGQRVRAPSALGIVCFLIALFHLVSQVCRGNSLGFNLGLQDRNGVENPQARVSLVKQGFFLIKS